MLPKQKLLILLSIIVLALIIAGCFYYSKKQSEQDRLKEEILFQQELEEKSKEYQSDFPKATKEQSYDIAYYDMAIAEKDVELCQKIQGEELRSNCLNYLNFISSHKE